MRRLPIYLLLDCSGSMAGEPATAVRTALRMLLSDLQNHPLAREAAWLSLVTFDSVAQQVHPLSPLGEFQMPDITPGGLSSLSDAFELATQLLREETSRRASAPTRSWKPFLFLWTDGQATDNWEKSLESLRGEGPADIVVCGAGPRAETALLQRMGNTILHLEDLQPGTLGHCLKWEAA